MKKKLIALLLASMMVAGLAGCGGGTDNGGATSSAGETSASEENAVVVDTTILKEQDDDMLNTYTVIAVNPDAPFVDANGNAVSDVAINTEGADALIHWLLLDETLETAANIFSIVWMMRLFTKVKSQKQLKRPRPSVFPRQLPSTTLDCSIICCQSLKKNMATM